jgi:hypothetical protein
MSTNPISPTKSFFNRKWVLLVSGAVLVAFAAFVTVSWLSITIKSYPSCLSYQSNENAQLDRLLKGSFGHYLVAHGFKAVSSESDPIKWDSRSVSVQWSSGWLNVCTRNEESAEWLNVAHDLQQISLGAHWSPEAYLHVNPDITACKTGNGTPLGFPIDFKKIGTFIKIVKTTCTGVR